MVMKASDYTIYLCPDLGLTRSYWQLQRSDCAVEWCSATGGGRGGPLLCAHEQILTPYSLVLSGTSIPRTGAVRRINVTFRPFLPGPVPHPWRAPKGQRL
jgi:hypothetical protein